jgi:hypothetical protein
MCVIEKSHFVVGGEEEDDHHHHHHHPSSSSSSNGWGMRHFGVRGGLYRVLVWNPEGKRPLRRQRHRWKNNIERYIKLVGKGWTG